MLEVDPRIDYGKDCNQEMPMLEPDTESMNDTSHTIDSNDYTEDKSDVDGTSVHSLPFAPSEALSHSTNITQDEEAVFSADVLSNSVDDESESGEDDEIEILEAICSDCKSSFATIKELKSHRNKVHADQTHTIWTTRIEHPEVPVMQDGKCYLEDLEFYVNIVWKAGYKMDKWPFENVNRMTMETAEDKGFTVLNLGDHQKGYIEVEKYVDVLRPGKSKQDLSDHWMLCEIHPCSTDDVKPYGDLCNWYKNLEQVAAAMCKSKEHEHLIFYLCAPDEDILPNQYIKDVFDCNIPKKVLWCLIFTKKLS